MTHSLRGTMLFRVNNTRKLLEDQLVRSDSSWMTATGIPPQVVMFGLQEQIKRAVCALPEELANQFVRLLEEKGIVGGGRSLPQLEATIRRVWDERSPSLCPTASSSITMVPRTTVYLWPGDGKLHTLPESFEFPSTDVLHAWHLWWFGSEGAGQPPYRSICTSDLSTRKKRQTYSEWRVMMHHISAEIERQTGAPPPTSMTEQQAASLCVAGVSNLALGSTRRSRRPTQLKIITMLRLIRETEHANNTNARRLPFKQRKRKRQNE